MPLTDLLVHWWFPLTPLIGFSGLAVSSNAIVCPAGLNGRTDELSLFPSVESFIRAQGASTSNTLQRRHASTTARHGSVCDQAGVDIMTERTPTFASVTSELDLELDNCGAGAAAGPFPFHPFPAV